MKGFGIRFFPTHLVCTRLHGASGNTTTLGQCLQGEVVHITYEDGIHTPSEIPSLILEIKEDASK